MAHHKSALKRINTNARDNLRNKIYMSTLKTQLKKVRSAENKQAGEEQYRKATSMLDKLVSKGIIHKNRAANQKSKLAAVVRSLQ
ncbi:30S ribosomal protein S20 [candidate division KSB1 bacterium]|nr:30S ribosomal protein S20 [candidate division KSB1 bacterium]